MTGTRSIWLEEFDRKPVLPADSSFSTDVCIVGAGIAGLTLAYQLSKMSRHATVLDAGVIGGGETLRTTAHLSNAIDDRIYRIEKWHGPEKARLAVESHQSAIDTIEKIVELERIDCDFKRVDGYLCEAGDGEDDLDEELAACHRTGLTRVRSVDKLPLADLGARALHFPNQAQFNVARYLSALRDLVIDAGGSIFETSRVVEWTGGAQPVATLDSGARVEASSLVLATNYPLQCSMFAQLPAYRTYAVAIEAANYPDSDILIWDTGEPYHYVRFQNVGNKRHMIVGGEDHRTGQGPNGSPFAALEDWARARFPQLGNVEFAWSGQCLETFDGLAFLGRHSEDEKNVYLITGDSGMGMTHGTIGATLIADLIGGVENAYAEVYDPSRLATQSISEAIPEIVNSTLPYADWLTPGEVDSAESISPGEGAILRDGLHKIAAFRDEQGELTTHSATCTHLGGLIRFNAIEKSWDCPCHGSRFARDGKPLCGPAISPLKKRTM